MRGGIVFILGAGASYGDKLHQLHKDRVSRVSVQPPLINGFFRKELWDSIGYSTVEKDFRGVFAYIQRLTQIPVTVRVGEGTWRDVNLEEIFTSIEIEREFRGAESDTGSQLIIFRNQLVRYIARILAFSTQGVFGKHTRLLADSLEPKDSVLSFNYDLLIDQELVWGKGQYYNFFDSVFEGRHGTSYSTGGLLLKMHGSLNWMQCTNTKCPAHSEIRVADMQECLNRALGLSTSDEACPRCGSEPIALLIPPLLRKPIADNWIFRSTWGLARHRLENADAVVLIGFSVPLTDFYAAWILRSTVGAKKGLPIFVVNPANAEGHDQHEVFGKRLRSIFPHGYNDQFLRFADIREVISQVRKLLTQRSLKTLIPQQRPAKSRSLHTRK